MSSFVSIISLTTVKCGVCLKKSKYDKILSIYSMLNSGEIIKKADIANEFGVTERTIQRDIDDIRAFYFNNTLAIGCGNTIIFDRKHQGYRLEDSSGEMLTNSEILAVCKILLESRTLVKSEMVPIIEKLLQRCVPEKNKKAVSQLIGNELFHYVEPHHGKQFVNNLWDLGVAIREHRYIELTYTRMSDRKTVVRKLKPVGIMVSEFYFYLTAFIEDINKQEHFENPDDLFPTIYRIDRICNIDLLYEKFNIPYSSRFEEGEFRKRVQFMYGGKLQKITFKYSGPDVNSVLDRLPTAEILSENNGGFVLTAEVFGKGIDMWLRSQGDFVELII